MSSFTLPTHRDPTDDEVIFLMDMLGDHEWFSDYDNGISITIGGETKRVGPGQTINLDGDTITIMGDEIPMHKW